MIDYYDLEREWNRRGNLRTLRAVPPGSPPVDPLARWDMARAYLWIAVVTLALGAALAVAYSAVLGAP